MTSFLDTAVWAAVLTGCNIQKLSASSRAAVVMLFNENHVRLLYFSSMKRFSAFPAAKPSRVGMAKQWHDAAFLLLPRSFNAWFAVSQSMIRVLILFASWLWLTACSRKSHGAERDLV